MKYIFASNQATRLTLVLHVVQNVEQLVRMPVRFTHTFKYPNRLFTPNDTDDSHTITHKV